ncbi:MAG: aspartate-semialdehyde dehydrogenase [Candidatus Omnitrophota bacterium]
MKKYNVAVIGVGVVGVEILKILRERSFPVSKLRVFARSSRRIDVEGFSYEVEAIEGSDFSGVDIALFAGTEGEKGASLLYAKEFIEKGAVVIDNGKDFRLNDNVPLIVPEVNRDKISKHKGLIANPNCTTIQAVVALGGIYKAFGLEKIILTSFQAVSGAGKNAVLGLWEEVKILIDRNKGKDFYSLGKAGLSCSPLGFSRQIAFNVIPEIGEYDENGYTSEEIKVVEESHKIFGDSSIKISSTCVRVPVFTSHSEAIYFRTRKNANIDELTGALRKSEGVSYCADSFTLPLDSQGCDCVFVSRLRRDPYEDNSFWLWCVSDNLRKGAALNAVQIAENLIRS